MCEPAVFWQTALTSQLWEFVVHSSMSENKQLMLNKSMFQHSQIDNAIISLLCWAFFRMRKDSASIFIVSISDHFRRKYILYRKVNFVKQSLSFPTTQAFTNHCKFFRFQKNQVCICNYKTQEHSNIEHWRHIGEKRQYIRRYLSKKREFWLKPVFAIATYVQVCLKLFLNTLSRVINNMFTT